MTVAPAGGQGEVLYGAAKGRCAFGRCGFGCGAFGCCGFGRCAPEHGAPKLSGEVFEVRGAGSAPSVDRLVGVANRHDRVPTEKFSQQPGLHDAGVLIFVEEHDPVLVAKLLRNSRHSAHNLESESHLVGVFNEAAAGLDPGELPGQFDEQRKTADRARQLDRSLSGMAVAGWQGFQGREPRGHCGHFGRIRDVLT